MRGTRGGLLGALAALLLAGCATYSDTYYYDDGYAGGDYFYERDPRAVGSAVGFSSSYGNSFWSPAFSSYYTSILYPPYWRSYDPWYTPGWYYGNAYAPGAGWHLGWSSYYGNPWWRSNWYSPFRYGSYYAWGGYGGYGHGGYGYGGWYDWYRHDSSRYWRDRERTLGRRGYEPSRRWGNDNSASEEMERIARRNDAAGYAPRGYDPGRSSDYDGRSGGGEPSAYDRRGQSAGRYGQPSRFGNPQSADREAQGGQAYGSGRSAPDDSGRSYGTRESGWIAPAEGGLSRRNRQPAYGDDTLGGMANDAADRGDAPQRTTRYQQSPRDAQSGLESRSSYRRIDAPRQEYSRPAYGQDGGGDARRQQSPSYDAPAREQTQRSEQPERYEQPSRRDAPRYEAPESDSSSRYESAQRNSSPRYDAPARSESPRYDAPARDDSPRYEQPAREESSSSSRELDRLSRDPE